MTAVEQALWANQVTRDCILAGGDDIEAALAAAEYIISTQPMALSTDAQGHEHRGKGEGGGQFVSKGNSQAKLKISNDATDHHHGQTIAKLKARTEDGKLAAYLDYSVYEGKPHIDMVEAIIPGMRAGEALVGKLAEEYGYENIAWGMMTPDGFKLRNRLDEKYGIERGTENVDVDAMVKKAGGKVLDDEPGREEGSRHIYVEFDSIEAGKKFAEKLQSMTEERVDLQEWEEQGKAWVDGTIVASRSFVRKKSSATPALSAAFAHDIHNPQAQNVLNRSLKAVKGLSAAARKDLAAALKGNSSGEAIVSFIGKYRLQLAKLLTSTQLAALLEGASEVAAKVPTLATFPGAVAPPPTLEPQEAVALVERLEKTKDAAERARIIADLPPEQQEYARQAVVAKEAHAGTPPPRWGPPAPPEDEPDGVHFPTIDAAVKNLAERNVLDRQRYDALDAAARAKAFTVANVQATETLEKIRDSLAENVKEGADYATWREKVLEEVDEGTFLGDAHNECFLPGTVVEGAVLAASKVWYSGPAVEIETDSGSRLRVTIHHPILTPAGWKHAGVIKEGEYLICYMDGAKSFDGSGFPSERIAVDDQHVPSRIEDVFQSVLMQTVAALNCQRPVRALDFHGDGLFCQGDINCVWADRHLMPDADINGLECVQEANFVHGDESAPLRSTRSAPGLLDPLGKASLSSARSLLCRDNSSLDSIRPLIGAESVPVRPMRFGKSANLDPRRFHATDKSPGGDVQLARKLIVSLPGLVSTDRVRKVKFIRWTGHVYDLQTATGFIVSQGIISGNCVFRTNVQTAFSDGQAAVLSNPLVRSGFPYATYDSIHDDRRRENHGKLEHLGIQGTNIYRIDDPVFQTFRPPWDFSDRCGWAPITVRQAAERGIEEAKRWLADGVEPAEKAFVPMPDFRPPEGFQRSVAGAPLSIQLSMQSLGTFSVPLSHHAPAGGATVGGTFYPGGEFIPAGVMANATPEERAAVEGHSNPEAELPPDLDLAEGLAAARGMRKRLANMVRVAKDKLAPLILKLGDMGPSIIPNAYDHARNALMATAVPGVPVNDIALGLSGVIAWAWKKAKEMKKGKEKGEDAAAMSLEDEDRVKAILEATAILYEMAGLPEGTPLPTEEAVRASLEKKQDDASLSTDAQGHEHRGKGPGGGQYVKKGGKAYERKKAENEKAARQATEDDNRTHGREFHHTKRPDEPHFNDEHQKRVEDEIERVLSKGGTVPVTRTYYTKTPHSDEATYFWVGGKPKAHVYNREENQYNPEHGRSVFVGRPSRHGGIYVKRGASEEELTAAAHKAIGIKPKEAPPSDAAFAFDPEQPRADDGTWTKTGIPAHIRPKKKDGTLHKSEDLHAAAKDPKLAAKLRKEVRLKDKRLFDMLLEKLRSDEKPAEKKEKPEQPPPAEALGAKMRIDPARPLHRGIAPGDSTAASDLDQSKVFPEKDYNAFGPGVYLTQDEARAAGYGSVQSYTHSVSNPKHFTDKREYEAAVDQFARQNDIDDLAIARVAFNKSLLQAGHDAVTAGTKRGLEVVVLDTSKLKAIPATSMADKHDESPEHHQSAVLAGMKHLDTGNINLVSLADLRDHLHEQGMDRAAQDAAIHALRKAGKVSATNIEGRHGTTERERNAAIKEGDNMLGYLALRG